MTTAKKRQRKKKKSRTRRDSFCSHAPALAQYDARTRHRVVEMLFNYVAAPATGELGPVVEQLLVPFTDSECAALYHALLECADTKGIDVEQIRDQFGKGRYTAGRSIIELGKLSRLEQSLRRELKKLYRGKLDGVPRPRCSGTGLSARFREVRQLFGLSEDEADILLVTYLAEYDRILSELIASRKGLGCVLHSLFDRETAVSVLSALPRSRVRRLLSQRGKLRRIGLIDERLALEDELAEFLYGLSDKPLVSDYFTEWTGQPLPLERHFAVTEDLAVLRRLILDRRPETPLHILLYGPAGAGKTEFSRSLARDLGRTIRGEIPAADGGPAPLCMAGTARPVRTRRRTLGR